MLSVVSSVYQLYVKYIMFVFNIDRGGTFTDFYVQEVTKNQIITQQYSFKVPSISSKGEGPIVGIINFLVEKNLMKEEDTKIPSKFIKQVNLGTTIATNALLQRKGVPNALILSEGFQDLLEIRHQARPNIFDLKCQLPKPLTDNVYESDGRIYRNEIPEKNLYKKGEGIYYAEPSNENLEKIYEEIKKNKIDSVGISLCNSYLCGEGQRKIADFFSKKGISNVQIGAKYASAGYLKRTQTTNLDAYLNPIMKQYFQNLLTYFDETPELKIMKSDGGFTSVHSINASQLLLSGPAGGLIGYARMVGQFEDLSSLSINNMVGLDMGGTSTDISKVLDRQISITYNFSAEGVEICTPHLQIQTIAAGGGSKLGFFNGLLTVGPESVGSNPGPVCYGTGKQLALTDANLILNRLDSRFFPKVFGKDKKSGLQLELSLKAFEELSKQINKNDSNKTIFQIAEGYIEIANQLMAKSARKILTMGRPDALVIFGSAAGQHCCDIGEKIGVDNIIINKYSGVLSAFGLSKAYETHEEKVYLGLTVDKNKFQFEKLLQYIEKRKKQQEIEIEKKYDQIKQEVTVGYKGTSFNLIIGLHKNIIELFETKHKEENGFSLPTSEFRLQYLRQTYIKYPPSFNEISQVPEPENPANYLIEESEVYLSGKFVKIPKYDFNKMKNCKIQGPAILLSHTSSILVKGNWNATIFQQDIHLKRNIQVNKQNIQQKIKEECDPIKLTLYSTRLMGIAEEMGKVLQKTSISTNIKERLDFSCGIFDWDGKLLANAPHLPVHLGSMETTVLEQIKRGIKTGDVILTNHPQTGGSHLPDLTIITCFQIGEGKNLYVASRGHHADIGGITPGSMPPFSKTIQEEGVAIEKFEIVKQNKFLDKQTRQLFAESRRLNDNISDLQAQIAANEFGMKLLLTLIKDQGLPEFCQYVKYICENASESVSSMLYNFSLSNAFPEVHSIQACEYMDDGTALKLKLTIDRNKRKATFDFSGTGPEVKANTNAPKAITKSAIIYCLRSLVQSQIPLNSGCLEPVDIIIPQNSILSPSEKAAVVGGNVQTSQKLCDLILKPFSFVACSQGTMNNFLFGNQKYCYYETICGGSGAGNGFNGKTIQCHMTNTRITDAEHLEDFYPVVLVCFKKKQNSGGKGKYKGGDGVIREMMFLEPMQVSLLSERREYSPYGLCGGQNGEKGKNWLINKEGKKDIGGKNCLVVNKYDIVRIETPSGGGYGQQK